MDFDPREEAERIYSAEVQSEVKQVIAELADSDAIAWSPLGGGENNASITDVQKSTAEGALAELIVNSFDAILTKRYCEEYDTDEYIEGSGIETYMEAAEELLAADHDEEVRIIADGPTERGDEYPNFEHPNITVSDTGRGRSPAEFSNFVEDVMEIGVAKQSWPFAQGMYGMGSHASLGFCGDDPVTGAGYKLIASASASRPGTWTWTLIRRSPDHGATFEYLTIDGEFPTFEGEFAGREVGTVIKLFNYQLDKKSGITGTSALRGRLDLELVENPLPITLEERRYSHRSTTSVMTLETEGAHANLKGHDAVDETIRRRITDSDLESPLQGVEVMAYLFHDDDVMDESDDLPDSDTKKHLKGSQSHHEDHAIIFVANGEKHASLSEYYLRRRCNLYNTAHDVKVIVDATPIMEGELGDEDFRRVFDPSRNGLRDTTDIADTFEQVVLDAIQDMEPLYEEEQRRKMSQIDPEQATDMQEEILDVVEQAPGVADYLNTGEFALTGANKGGTDYDREEPPTTFEIIETNGREMVLYDGEEGEYEATTPANRAHRQEFKLNAPNGYFESATDPSGDFVISPADGDTFDYIESWGLIDGVLSVRVDPDAIETGDEIEFTALVTLPDGSTLAERTFTLTVTDPVDSEETTTTSPPSTDDEDGVGLPKIHPDENGILGEDEYAEVHAHDDETVVYVDMEADPLASFHSSHNFKQWAQETVNETWRVGIGLTAFFGYVDAQQDDDTEEEIPEERASEAARSIAPFFLPFYFSDDIDEMTA